MKQLSRWAKCHPIAARIIIIGAHFLLVADALWLGFLSYAEGIVLPHWLLLVFCNLFFLAYFLYPLKKSKKGLFKHSYEWQKTMDFVLVAAYASAIVVGINLLGFGTSTESNDNTGSPVLIALKLKSEIVQEKTSIQPGNLFARLSNAVIESKAKLKAELKVLKDNHQSRTSPNSDYGLLKFFLVLLAVGFFLGLILLITFFSCSLSCSGNGGAAIALALLGTTAAIWLLVIAIKGIVRIRKKTKEETLKP
jgi:hypothetical protein